MVQSSSREQRLLLLLQQHRAAEWGQLPPSLLPTPPQRKPPPPLQIFSHIMHPFDHSIGRTRRPHHTTTPRIASQPPLPCRTALSKACSSCDRCDGTSSFDRRHANAMPRSAREQAEQPRPKKRRLHERATSVSAERTYVRGQKGGSTSFDPPLPAQPLDSPDPDWFLSSKSESKGASCSCRASSAELEIRYALF